MQSLTFQEVRRAAQALSHLYVERRRRLGGGGALDGAGKRAAFALFYGPIHFLTVRQIVRSLGASEPKPSGILDLGCGTGAAGAAWALEAAGVPSMHGADIHPWAVAETRWTYRRLGLSGRASRLHACKARMPRGGGAVLAAFTVNELGKEEREELLPRFLTAASAGSRVLVVEPIARRNLPWWDLWADRFRDCGGREDTWRFPVELPELVQRIDRAAGLDHSTLTARSLYLA
jgi:hypothetical protein